MSSIKKTIAKQIEELLNFYPGLECYGKNKRHWLVSGPLHFKATFNDKVIENCLNLYIIIPDSYPEDLPIIKEVRGKKLKGFSHVNPDGTFCLATPIMVRSKLKESNSLLDFVENLLIPFLFSGFYWKTFSRLPFAAASHGGAGILEEYCILLDIHSPDAAKSFLKMLATNFYPLLNTCPCGNKKTLKECHYPRLLELSKLQSQQEFKFELDSCVLSKY